MGFLNKCLQYVLLGQLVIGILPWSEEVCLVLERGHSPVPIGRAHCKEKSWQAWLFALLAGARGQVAIA